MDRADFGVDRLSAVLGEDVSRRVVLRRLAGGGLAAVVTAGGLRPAAPAAAQEGTPAATDAATIASPVAGEGHRFRLGQFDCLVLSDGDYVVPAPFIAINAPPAELAAAVAQTGQSMDGFTTTINILVVDTGDHLVLVDTGFGAFAPTTGKLLPALQAAGIAPGDVDTVILTHLHGDHFGAALDAAGAPTFANARYLINRTEYEFWEAEPSLAELPLDDDFKRFFREGAKGTLVGLDAVIEQFEPGAEVVPGITVVAAPGHTPGHIALELASDGERLLHIVDAATDPILHLHHPDWFLLPDNWPAFAVMTRRQLFDRAAAEDLLVLTYHFGFPGLGRVRPDGDGWLWETEA